jgi:hypothetical protein
MERHRQAVLKAASTDLPAAPFSNVAINWRAKTGIHHDFNDLGLCVIIALGEFTDFGVCLGGMNTVFELQHGQVLVFDSRSTPHFNRDGSGDRHSIVLHTNRHLEKWSFPGLGWEVARY